MMCACFSLGLCFCEPRCACRCIPERVFVSVHDSHNHAWAVCLSYLCDDGGQRCSETGCDVYAFVSVCMCVRVCACVLVDCSLTPGISSSNPHTTSYSRTSPMQITFSLLSVCFTTSLKGVVGTDYNKGQWLTKKLKTPANNALCLINEHASL